MDLQYLSMIPRLEKLVPSFAGKIGCHFSGRPCMPKVLRYIVLPLLISCQVGRLQ
uniref:NIT1 n=1 Tax=Arundo donax TaxID=35708 RepID=A0A0A9BE55_ARUDO